MELKQSPALTPREPLHRHAPSPSGAAAAPSLMHGGRSGSSGMGDESLRDLGTATASTEAPGDDTVSCRVGSENGSSGPKNMHAEEHLAVDPGRLGPKPPRSRRPVTSGSQRRVGGGVVLDQRNSRHLEVLPCACPFS